jgi:hypothetical protein
MIGIFLCFLFSEKPAKDPDYYRNNKNDDKNSDTHSGFKNVSN